MWASRSTSHTRRMARSLAVAGVTAALAAVALVAAAGASAAALSATAGAAQASSSTPGIKLMPTLEAQMLDAINVLRSSQGLVSLRPSVALGETARQHSQSMAESGFFDHASLNGAPFW